MQKDVPPTYAQLLTYITDKFSEAFGSLGTRFRSSGDGLVGFEFAEILNAAEGETVAATMLPLNDSIRSWSALVENDNIVFGSGFGNVFKAEITTGQIIPPCSLKLSKINTPW